MLRLVGFRVPGIYTALKLPLVRRTAEASFRVPGIYTALKQRFVLICCLNGFRVPGIYTALKRWSGQSMNGQVLEYLEFTQLSNRACSSAIR